MAVIQPKGALSGAIGAVYFRVLNGKTIAQSMPKKHSKAAETLFNASVFGRASSFAKSIRQELFPIVQDKNDNLMYRRFVAVVHEVFLSVAEKERKEPSLSGANWGFLAGFEFNIHSPYTHYSSVLPAIYYTNGVLQLDFPAFTAAALTLPAAATTARIVTNVSVMNPTTKLQGYAENFVLEVTSSHQVVPATSFSTGVLPQGQLALLTIAVYYYRDTSLSGPIALNSKTLHPCMLLEAFQTV